MPCPFPGMDPYLEMQPDWSDFSPRFLSELGNELLRHVLPHYNVRIEEYLMLSEEDLDLHRVRPDAVVTTGSGARQSAALALAPSDSLTAELEYPDFDLHTQRQLRVIHRETERVVTVVELLSPSNKARGAGGLDLYVAKRAEFLASPCNLVEIDLLRGGERLPMAGTLPPGDYYAYVGRMRRKPRCEVVGWPLRARLPTIPIPLLPEDDEVSLDLQKAFTAAYEPALFDRRLPYQRPLVPPLGEEDDRWVREKLGAKS